MFVDQDMNTFKIVLLTVLKLCIIPKIKLPSNQKKVKNLIKKFRKNEKIIN